MQNLYKKFGLDKAKAKPGDLLMASKNPVMKKAKKHKSPAKESLKEEKKEAKLEQKMSKKRDKIAKMKKHKKIEVPDDAKKVKIKFKKHKNVLPTVSDMDFPKLKRSKKKPQKG